MGRPSLAEQRRVEICRALQSCVIRNGSYEMTSVKDIAQEAGMAAGMLHHYFESKDDILQVTAEMVLLELQNHLSDLLRIKDAALGIVLVNQIEKIIELVVRELLFQLLRQIILDVLDGLFIIDIILQKIVFHSHTYYCLKG